MACETERVLIEDQIKLLLKNNRDETKYRKNLLNLKEGFNFGYKSHCKTSHEQQIREDAMLFLVSNDSPHIYFCIFFG